MELATLILLAASTAFTLVLVLLAIMGIVLQTITLKPRK